MIGFISILVIEREYGMQKACRNIKMIFHIFPIVAIDDGLDSLLIRHFFMNTQSVCTHSAGK